MASKKKKGKKTKEKKIKAVEENPQVEEKDLETLRKLNEELVNQRLTHSKVCENIAAFRKREGELLLKVSEKTTELQETSNKIAEKYVKNPKEWSLNLQTGKMSKT